MISDTLIGRNHQVETRRFGLFQQVPVLELDRPTCLDEGANVMMAQEAPHTDGDVLIKNDAQRDDFRRRQ